VYFYSRFTFRLCFFFGKKLQFLKRSFGNAVLFVSNWEKPFLEEQGLSLFGGVELLLVLRYVTK